MSTLWTMGCSYTADYTTNLLENVTEGNYHLFRKYRGGTFPKTWPKLLSEKLNMDVVNLGFPGADNYTIFQQFNDNCHKIQSGDMVIVGWSMINRFRMAHPKNNHFTLFTSTNDNLLDYWSSRTIEEIFVNRLSKTWTEEIYGYTNLIEQLGLAKGFNTFFWSADPVLINEESNEFKNQRKFLLPDCELGMIQHLINNHGALNISFETEHTIKDTHLGQQGHEVMADLFYDDIIKKV